MTIEEVKEVKAWDHKTKEYASKGTGNAALALGIVGTGLALFGGKGFNLFGGKDASCNGGVNTMQEVQYVERKECQDNLDLTRAIYGMRINSIQEGNAAREVLNQELFGLYKNQRDSYDVLDAKIGNLSTQVAVGAAVRPYQDKLIQCEIDKAYVSGINYTDRKTCRMITGEVVLPNTPIVTGLGSYGCNCHGTSRGGKN